MTSLRSNLLGGYGTKRVHFGQTAGQASPSSLRHSMPRFFFAFKWADYARVPLLCAVCTVQRAGMGRIRIGKVAKGERERERGAWQQNIYTLRIADYAANLARWMRPPCSKSYFHLDWHHVAGWHL